MNALNTHYIIERLEDAGRTLAMLPMPKNGVPLGPHSAWPAVEQRFSDVMAVMSENETAAQAMARRDEQAELLNRVSMVAPPEAIARLDEVLRWLWYIERPLVRQVVTARMAVNPRSGSHMIKWSKLSRSLGVDRSTARRWFDEGVAQIGTGIRKPLATHTAMA